MTPDFEAINARYQLAREAGRAMSESEGDGRMSRGRVNALVAAWNDIPVLYGLAREHAMVCQVPPPLHTDDDEWPSIGHLGHPPRDRDSKPDAEEGNPLDQVDRFLASLLDSGDRVLRDMGRRLLGAVVMEAMAYKRERREG